MNVCMCSVYVNNYVVTLGSMDVCAAKQNEILSDTDSDEDNDQSSDEEKSIQEKPKEKSNKKCSTKRNLPPKRSSKDAKPKPKRKRIVELKNKKTKGFELDIGIAPSGGSPTTNVRSVFYNLYCTRMQCC